MCNLALIAILSYLLGSIPFSYLIARAYGKNLFEIGSRNIGAVNVYRATRKIEALLSAVIGDVGKGALAISLCYWLSFLGYNLLFSQAIAAFFVVLGHNWPIFLKFKGGRGLASLIGALFVLNWKVIFLVLGVVLIFILLIELVMKKRIELRGNFKEKIKNLFSIFISQVLGRVIGIAMAAISVFILYPETFKIVFPAAILAGIKHIKRTKSFLKGERV